MKQLVIMPGGFHPFHAGHAALYQSAVEAFPGADVYVAATNDTSTRPFPFPVKEKLAQLAGVAPNRFVQVKSPFRAEEIVHKYDPSNTQLIFVRSEKDAGSPPRPGGVKKDGTPSYLQPYNDASDRPLSQSAYMAYLPTVEFGPGMTSATEIRGAWPKLNEKRKTALVMSLYPKTQTNPRLAATVVKLLDTAMGTELNEFAPGNGGGESGRWYTDDQMTDLVGDGWWEDMDVSGNIPKQQMIQQAQAWLDDQGYSVHVLNCKLNDDDMDWFIEGSFYNPRFAKKGVAEKLGDNRPKLGSKRDAGKSIRKWRSARGLDETGVAEEAPPGDKAERMVKHIKKSYAKDGKITDKEKGIAYATAWKAHNAGKVEEAQYDRGDYYNARMAGEYGKGMSASLDGGGGDGPGRGDIHKGQTKHLPADPFGRASGDAPQSGKGKIYTKALPDEMDEGEQQKGADYRDPPEADYGDDYQDMVARVKKLAGLGPLKTVYDPAKRVYRNVPTAVQPKK